MIDIKKCPYCSSQNRSLIAEQTHEDKYLALVDKELNQKRRFLYKCEQCDYIYRSPMVSEEEARVLYSKYRSFEFRKITPSDYFDKMTAIPESESETYAKAKYIKENIQNIHSILDIGCGGGIFLYQLNKIFPNSYILGLEPNSDYAKMVRDKMNIDVVEDFYKEDNIEKIFDLTVSTDVIEHIHDLDIFWKATINNIHKGKYLFLEIPSIDNFEHLDISHDVFESPHLYFFDKEHIIEFGIKYGFELISDKKVVNREVYKDWYIFKKIV